MTEIRPVRICFAVMCVVVAAQGAHAQHNGWCQGVGNPHQHAPACNPGGGQGGTTTPPVATNPQAPGGTQLPPTTTVTVVATDPSSTTTVNSAKPRRCRSRRR